MNEPHAITFDFHNSLEVAAPGCLGSRDFLAPAHGAFVVLCLGCVGVGPSS